MKYVCFRNAFRGDSAPCINHVTKPDDSATFCGRRGWYTNEEPYDPGLGVDCLQCTKALKKWSIQSGEKS